MACKDEFGVCNTFNTQILNYIAMWGIGYGITVILITILILWNYWKWNELIAD